MCKFRAHRTTPTAKKWDSRGDIFAMTKMGRVSGFWRFLGKYLGTGPKIPYWEPTGENPWISGPEDIPTLKAMQSLEPQLGPIFHGSFTRRITGPNGDNRLSGLELSTKAQYIQSGFKN